MRHVLQASSISQAPHKNQTIFVGWILVTLKFRIVIHAANRLRIVVLQPAMRTAFLLGFRYGYLNEKVFCSPELPNQEFLSPCCLFDTSITCAFPRPRVVGEHISCYFARSPARFFLRISRRPQRSGSASPKRTAGVKQ